MARKRHRDAEEGGSYQHFVPFGDHDLLDIHFHEGRLQRKFTTAPTATSARITQKSEYWNVVEKWGPFDDPEFALDLDGTLYNEALDAPVMQDTNSLPVAVEKKARSKVSVSILMLHLLHCLYVFIPACDRGVLTSSGKNLIVPLTCKNCYDMLAVVIFETQRTVPTAFPVQWMSLVCPSTVVKNALRLILRVCRAVFDVINGYLFIGLRCVLLTGWLGLH